MKKGAKIKPMNRLLAMLICITMVFGMLPVLTSAAEVSDRVADPSTMDGWKQYFERNDTAYAGGVWTDKSVFDSAASFAGAGVTMKDGNNNFLVALSSIASNKEIVGYSTLPTDTMLVLDLSNSMDGIESVPDLVSATNSAITRLLALNRNNRVGVVLYSGNTDSADPALTSSATVLLPLDRYTANAAGSFLTYTQTEDTNRNDNIDVDTTVSIANGVKKEDGTAVRTASKNTNGGTYIQNGLYLAWEQYSQVTDTSISASSIQAGTKRMPIIVLMSDGAPTIATTSYNNVGTSNTGNGLSTDDRITFLTQLTAAWLKAKVADHYETTDVKFYTLGLGTSNSVDATSVLYPSNSNTTVSGYWTNYLKGTTNGQSVAIIPNTSTRPNQNNGWNLSYDALVTGEYRNYVTNYWYSNNASGLINAFAQIIDEIVIQSQYYATLVPSGEHDVDGYISFEDELGEFMEVKDVKGIVIGDILFSGAEMAKALNEGALGTPGNSTNLGDEFVWTVMERLGIDSVSTAQQLIDAAYNAGQLSYTNASAYSNYIGWYADADGNFLAHWKEDHTENDYPRNAAYINRSYGYLGANGSSNMMHVVVQVHTNIQNNHQSVVYRIPASLIPMVTYTATVEGDTLVSGASATLNRTSAQPMQLLFEVGLRSDINAVNVASMVEGQHYHINADGEYEFYSNRWGGDSDNDTGDFDYTDPFSHLVAVSYFTPSVENERYYFTEDTYIRNAGGNLVTGPLDMSGNTTYYYAKSVISGSGDNARVTEILLPLAAKDLSYAVTGEENTRYIPKGTINQPADQYMIEKAANPTNTLKYSNFPTTINTDGTAAGYTMYTFHGNNGRITLAPAQGIALSKTVTEVVSGAPTEFIFDVTLSAAVSDPVITDANGTPLSGVATVNGNVITVTLGAGETVYITNLPTGITYTVTERSTDHYVAAAQGATGTVALHTIQDVQFTNAPRSFGDLIISKEVVHPFGSDPAALADKRFQFEVTLTGDGIDAGDEFTTSTNEILVVGTDGKLSFKEDAAKKITLKNDESITILHIPEGAVYAVRELEREPGFTLDTDNSDLTGTIPANDSAVALAVNGYGITDGVTPDITVMVNKILNHGEHNISEKFTFLVEWLNAEGTDYIPGETITLEVDSPSASSASAKLNKVFTEIGTYHFRMTEVAGTTPGMIYSAARGLFAVDVTDSNMDGQLEVAVRNEGNTQVTSSGSSYTVSMTFTNTYELNSTQVELNLHKNLKNETGVNLPLSGFRFGVYPVVNGEESTTPDYILTTGPRGNATLRIPITVDEDLTYIIREIIPDGSNGNAPLDGMTYDDTAYTVVIDVENVDGQLTATYTVDDNAADADTVLAFENTYALDSTSVTLEGTKTLEGRDPNGNEFTFTLVETDASFANKLTGSDVDYSVSIGEGKFTFPEITYTKAGTYHYVIRETAGNAGGMTYDHAVYHVTVTVAPDGSKLATTTHVTKLGEGVIVDASTDATVTAASFTNTYTVSGTTNWVLEGTKELTGRLMNSGEFTFGLFEDGATDPLLTAKNTANGTILFPAITYDQIGTHTYTAKELTSDGNGVTTDKSVYTVQVTVSDNGNGGLTASHKVFKGEAEADLIFSNSYSAKGTSVTVSGTKTLNGLTLKDGDFTFGLYGETGNEIKTTTNIDGAYSFTLSFNKAGRYYYSVREVIDNKTDINYDTSVYNIEVSVSDPGNGQLIAYTYVTKLGVGNVAQDELNFTNIYDYTLTDKEGSITIDVNKELDSAFEHLDIPFGKDGFQFQLSGGSLAEALSATSDVNGNASFTLDYTEQDIGKTYVYEITEIPGDITDIDYSTEKYTVTVKVDVTEDHLLSVSVVSITKDGADADEVVFTNTYDPTNSSKQDDLVIDVTKVLDGKFEDLDIPFGKDGFQFQLSGGSLTEALTATTDEDGKTSFTLSYTEQDIGKTYVYEIIEVAGDEADILYSTEKYTVTVKVDLDTDQSLAASIVSITKDSADADEVVFTNTYDPTNSSKQDDLVIDVTKVLDGKFEDLDIPFGKDGFQFQLTGGSLAEALTATTDEDGKTSFTLSYTEQDIGMTYVYEIVEVAGDEADILYSTEKYTVTVKVDLDTDQSLAASIVSITKDGADADEVVFTNTYDPTNSPKEKDVVIDITKVLDNKTDTQMHPYGFKFQLKDLVTNGTMTATSDKNGKAMFTLSFTEAHIGYTYSFELSEIDAGVEGMTYDDKVYTIQVSVGVDEDGNLATAVTLDNEAVDGDVAVRFTNTYEGVPLPPTTGDNADVALWTALLFFSTGALITLLVFGRPKKRRKVKA